MIREIFVIRKIKKTFPRTYVIINLNGEEIIGAFYEKEFQKTNQKEFRIEKIIKRRGNKVYFGVYNGKDMIILLIVGLIKKTLYKISQYFPKPYKSFEGNINIKVDFSNYAMKSDLMQLQLMPQN